MTVNPNGLADTSPASALFADRSDSAWGATASTPASTTDGTPTVAFTIMDRAVAIVLELCVRLKRANEMAANAKNAHAK